MEFIESEGRRDTTTTIPISLESRNFPSSSNILKRVRFCPRFMQCGARPICIYKREEMTIVLFACESWKDETMLGCVLF